MLMAGLLAVGSLGLASVTNAASLKPAAAEAGEEAWKVEVRDEDDSKRTLLPVGPGSVYYEYSLRDSRGFYPRTIRGYTYYNPKTYAPEYYADAGDEGIPYSAKERCAQRYRSFEWDTGLYTTYRGPKVLCPYLR